MLQQTPLAVMVAPPADVMLPPLLAVEAIMAEALAVVNVGATVAVVKITSLP